MTESGDELALRCLREVLAELAGAEAELGRLDAVAGDGDHGSGVVRGMRAAVRAAEDRVGDGDGGSLLEVAGEAFADAAGGSSGALYGTLCCTFGRRLREGADPVTALTAAVDAVMELGQAGPGDKTFIDTLAPFTGAVVAGTQRRLPRRELLHQALAAARAGADGTVTMRAHRGRAAALGDRSIGTADPGAVSMLHILDAVVRVLTEAPT